MAYLFKDEEIELIKLTVNNRTSSTSTFYFANDYYPAKSLWGTRRAARFVRANSEYLTLADSAGVSTGDIQFCVACWVYFDSLGTEQSICGKYATGQQEWLLLKTSADRLRFIVSNDGSTDNYVERSATVSANTWYFVVAWHDSSGNTINIQVNDGTADSTAHTTGVFDSTTAFQVGRWGTGSSYLDGRIDSLGYWKRIPSASERTAFYNSGAGVSYTDLSSGNIASLVGWWDLDEKSGDRWDASLNGRILSDQNTVTFEEGVGGNAAVWPLLTDSPRVRRSHGAFAGNRHNVSVRLLGHVPFDNGKTLAERWKSDVYLNSGTLEVHYRPKPNDRTHAETGSYTRQVLEVVDASYNDNDGTIFVEGRDTWFKNKELSIPLKSSDFNDLDRRYDSEPGAIYFGNGGQLGKPGVVTPAPIIDSLLNSGTKEPNLSLFTGWTFDGHTLQTQGGTLPRFYGRNKHRQVDPRDWIPCEFPSGYTTAAYGYGPGYSGFYAPGDVNCLASYSRAILFQPPTYGQYIHAVGIYGLGYPGGDYVGEFIVSIYQAQLTNTSASYTYAPVGTPLWTTTRNKDATLFTITEGETKFQLVPPLLCSPDYPYFVTVEWSNTKNPIQGPGVYVKAITGASHYYKPRQAGVGDGTWVKQADGAVAISVYILGRNGFHYLGSGTSRSASYYPVSGVDCRTWTSDVNTELKEQIEVKIGADGIKDTAGGAYTGTASATIQNPADIIAFTLLDDDFGCAVPAAKVSTTDWTDARTRLAAHPSGGLSDATVAIDQKISAEKLILDICRQSRLVFYKNRSGQLVIHYPRQLSALSTTATLSQDILQDELIAISYEDTPQDEIINDIEMFYYPDVMNLVDDPDLNRKGGAAYRQLAYCNESTQNVGSATYSTRCATSNSLYGRRQYREQLDIWNRDVRANEIIYYFVNRYSEQRQVAKIAVPRRDYYDVIDLTNKIVLNHNVLKDASIDGEFVATADYYDAGNVPQKPYDTGTLTGRVVDVQEFGGLMILTLETDTSYGFPSY